MIRFRPTSAPPLAMPSSSRPKNVQDLISYSHRDSTPAPPYVTRTAEQQRTPESSRKVQPTPLAC